MIHYEDDGIRLLHGDALTETSSLPDRSVDCIVTSPPYYGLRDYGTPDQYGMEETPAVFVEHLRELFTECRRVLTDEGTLWLNLGDSYSGGNRKTYDTDGGKTRARGHAGDRPASGLAGKNLLGIPWRTAFALQDDGWILRNSIIWHKPNAMPESVTDRLTCRHENLFLFSKQQRYWFDLDPIREELAYPEAADGSRVFGGRNKADALQTGSSRRRTGNTYRGKYVLGDKAQPADGSRHTASHPKGKNPGDVWSISTQPFHGAHFAVFPPELARRCIASGCIGGGTVLDPFNGSGTTGMVAQQHGRKYIGIDKQRSVPGPRAPDPAPAGGTGNYLRKRWHKLPKPRLY